MPRLFVAIDLPAPVKTQLAALQHDLAGAAWMTPAQMHLTLHFIGEVSEDAAEQIAGALKQVNAPAFTLAVQGTGTYPPEGKARVLWAGLPHHEALLALYQATGSALQQTGYQPDSRPYSPHITLARFKEPPSPLTLRRYLDTHRHFASEPFPVEQFVLYRSTLTPGGAFYSLLHRFPLPNVRKS
ncbi:MAG: RNA 2',3'-cyclic phosphodiesterase [Anaerolineae bacterium]|jgi:2'-5' RNA ligase|nr:RNA 2',3'-cyclic phosphodiesterase [Anaerolineae bacterium]